MSDAGRMRPRAPLDWMLRASLHPDPAVAGAAFARWRAQLDVDALDQTALQLLPLLVAEPGRLPIDEALDRQLRNAVRFTWLRTQFLTTRTAPVLRDLDAAGVRATLVKGAALIHAHGVPAKLRPMADLDVLVAPDDLRSATDTLNAHGFRSVVDPTTLRDRLHALTFRDDRGAWFDLHWHVVSAARHPAADAIFTSGAVPARMQGVACAATGREDTLLHVIAHGMRWAPARWVGDATLLLRRHGADFDWDRLAARARDLRIARSTLDALDYLADVAAIDAPGETRRALRRGTVPLAVRLRRRRHDDPADGAPVVPSHVGRLLEAYEEGVGTYVAPGVRTGPADGVRFLARRWGLPAARAVPAHALFVAAGRPWTVRRSWRRHRGAPTTAPDPRVPSYRLGSTLSFADDGDGGSHLRAGWWFAEPHGTWTRGSTAVIQLPLDGPLPADAALLLDARVTALVTSHHPRMSVQVVVNDAPVAVWTFGARGRETVRRTARIEPAVVAGWNRLELTFVVRHPIAPADAREGDDQRELGIAFHTLRIEGECERDQVGTAPPPA